MTYDVENGHISASGCGDNRCPSGRSAVVDYLGNQKSEQPQPLVSHVSGTRTTQVMWYGVCDFQDLSQSSAGTRDGLWIDRLIGVPGRRKTKVSLPGPQINWLVNELYR